MFENDDTVVLGISCDTTATLKVFAEQEGYEFQLLSDFWPHGAVTEEYGVFFEPGGFPLRATFIIDKAGVVRWSVVNGPGDARRTPGLPRRPRRARCLIPHPGVLLAPSVPWGASTADDARSIRTPVRRPGVVPSWRGSRCSSAPTARPTAGPIASTAAPRAGRPCW